MAPTWSDAQTPAASTSIEDLLERVLTGEGGDRVRALLDAINSGLGDVFIADRLCGNQQEPRVYTFRQFCKHVFDLDHPSKVATRGYRAHTTVNVEPWDPEQPGHGPGLKRGPS